MYEYGSLVHSGFDEGLNSQVEKCQNVVNINFNNILEQILARMIITNFNSGNISRFYSVLYYLMYFSIISQNLIIF